MRVQKDLSPLRVHFSVLALLLPLTALPRPVEALTLTYRDTLRYEVDPAVDENFAYKGISIGSDGEVYITDKAAGIHTYLAGVEHLDTFHVVFRSPDGEVDRSTIISYDDDTHCFYSSPYSWCYPYSVRYVDWWHWTYGVEYGQPGIWTWEATGTGSPTLSGSFEVVPRHLRSVTSTEPTLTVRQDGSFSPVPLSVQLLDFDDKTPVSDEQVTFRLVDSPNGTKGGGVTLLPDGQVGSSQVSDYTDHNGFATVYAVPGSKGGEYTVTTETRSAPDDAPVFSVNVVVEGKEHGKPKDPLADLDPEKNLGEGGDCVSPSGMAGNPINLATGNKYQKETDYTGAGPYPLRFARHYNSASPPAGSLGSHWRHTYDRSLHFYTEGKGKHAREAAAARRPNGRVYTFYLEGGQWLGDPDVRDRLEPTAEGWRYVATGNRTEGYDPEGRLLRLIDENGLAQRLGYTPAGWLEQVTGPFGRTLRFGYDASGRLDTLTDPDGGVFRYTYDAANNLVDVEYPDVTHRQYLYENSDFPNALTGIVDENLVRFVTWLYDDQGRGIHSEHAGGVDRVDITYNTDGTRRVTGTQGDVDRYRFEERFGFAKVFDLDQAACADCTPESSASYQYDDNGCPSVKTDARGNSTYYIYNDRGQQTSRLEGLGTPEARLTATTWHETLDLPVAIYRPGLETYFEYDSEGRLVEKTTVDSASGTSRSWQYVYNAQGLIDTEDGPRTDLSDVTRYEYNPDGTLLRRINALDQVITYPEYDAHGRARESVDANGLLTRLTYDPRGRLIQQQIGTETTGLERDATGRLVRFLLPDDRTLAFEYDAAGRLVLQRDDWGNETRVTLDDEGNTNQTAVYGPGDDLQAIRQWRYSALGQRVADVDAQGQETAYVYDPNGNLKTTTDANAKATDYQYDLFDRLSGQDLPDGGQVGYAYDGLDHLIAVTDPNNHTTDYAYNGFSQQLSVDSPDTGTTTYSYDLADNRLTETRANGTSLNHTYDALNRLTQSSDNAGETYYYTYDNCTNGIGRLCQITGSGVSSQWQYDSQGRVTEKTETAGGVTLSLGYAYNDQGQLIELTYPSGRRIGYHYVEGRVDSLTLDGSPLISGISYNAQQQVTGWIGSNGIQHWREYDLDGRLSRHSLAQDSRSLGYDPVGNIESLDDGVVIRHFGYDELDRLLTAEVPYQTFGYDLNGNRRSLSEDAGLSDYLYAADSNRLLAVQGPESSSYSYDAAGNMTDNGAHSFNFNARNRLESIDDGAIEYTYNAFGQRISKTTVAGTSVRFFYDEEGRLLGEYQPTGQAEQEIVYFDDRPIAVFRGATVYPIHTDHLGTPRAITDTAGTKIWEWISDSFGTTAPIEDPDGDGQGLYLTLGSLGSILIESRGCITTTTAHMTRPLDATSRVIP